MVKIQTILKIALSFIVFCFALNDGYSNKNPFKMELVNSNDIIECNIKVENNYSISIDSLFPSMTSLAITGKIIQLHENSFVRILLEDKHGKNYQVLESSRMYNDIDTVSLDSYGEETLSMYNVSPYKLKIFVTNARVEIDNLLYCSLNNLRRTYSQRISEIESLTNKRNQQLNIVDRINKYNIKHNALWRADTTYVSLLPWEKKKVVLGITDEGSYTNGIEYYAEGIYEVKSYSEFDRDSIWNDNLTSSLYVDEFDWRDRHGINWMTPVKHQGWTSACWAFASVGVCEAVANLYYNNKIDLDLSEQELISCSRKTTNPMVSSYIQPTLQWIKDNGIIDELAFPFDSSLDPIPCSEKNEMFSEHLFINGMTQVNCFPDSLKKYLIKLGPLAVVYRADGRSGHAVVLTGYGKLKEGDGIKISTSSGSTYSYIHPNDTRIGKTYWICKNSYGTDSGEGGYIKLYFPDYDGGRTVCGVIPSISTLNYDIVISDNDNDGYYFWGLGPKPSGCPDWIPDIPDGDDSDYSKGPMDEYGRLKELNPDLNDTVYISSNTTYLKKRFIYNHTVITEGNSLSLNNETIFYNNAIMKIQNGGTLIVDSAIVRNANIVVEQGGNLIVRNNGQILLVDGESFYIPQGANLSLINGVIQ